MAVIRNNHFSNVLHQNIECMMVIPENASESDIPLKVIWLYHGGGSDHTSWLYNTNIVRYAEQKKVAFVMPLAHNSCFVDMNIGREYGKYIGDELPHIIWNMFPILSEKREDNYIAGFSNGGYGALSIILNYPEKFAAVGAFSAGDKADSDYVNDGSAKAVSRIRLFGDGDLNQNKYGIKYLTKRLLQDEDLKGVSDKDIQLPRIYHACGDRDPWLKQNHILRDFFMSYQNRFNYTYDEMQNMGHEWEFWEAELVKFLEYI